MNYSFFSALLLTILISGCNDNQTPKDQLTVAHNRNTENSERSEFNVTEVESNDCSELPNIFNSSNEAISLIENTEFEFTDEVNTSKSSWIRGAKYFSCDGQFGFFILTTDKKDYLYQDLPVGVWNGFKNSKSFGNFYNKKIKHRYPLKLTSFN